MKTLIHPMKKHPRNQWTEYNHAALGFLLSALGSIAIVTAIAWMVCKITHR